MCKRKSGLYSTSGQSLIGIIIASSIAVTTILALTKLLTSSIRGAKYVEAKLDWSEVDRSVELLLSRPDLCGQAFWSSTIDPKTKGMLPARFNPADPTFDSKLMPSSLRIHGRTLAQIGSPVAGLTIDSISLTELSPAGRVSGPGTITYLANLELRARPTVSQTFQALPPQNYLMNVTTDKNTHVITSCSKPLKQECPSGQVVNGFDSNGNVQCKTALAGTQQCPSGQAMVGMNAGGSIICAPVQNQFVAQQCPAGQKMRGIAANGTITCAPLECRVQVTTCYTPGCNAQCPDSSYTAVSGAWDGFWLENIDVSKPYGNGWLVIDNSNRGGAWRVAVVCCR